jgi:hypothetical protein
MPKSGTKSSIPPISWDANQHALTWALLNELEKQENFKVLFGKKDPKEVSQCAQPGAAALLIAHSLEHLR